MKKAFHLAAGLVVLGIISACSGRNEEKKLGDQVVPHIKLVKRENPQAHEIDVINDSDLAYRKCDMTLTVYRENGSKADVKRYWDTWASKEKRTMSLPADGRIERVEVVGTLYIPNIATPGFVSTAYTFPAVPAQPPTPTVNSFTARRDEGNFSHDLIYKYTGAEKLEDVKLTLTVYYDRGEKPVIPRFYATWLPDEEKKVNVPAKSGIVQKHEFTGTAKRNGTEVVLEATFNKKAPGEK